MSQNEETSIARGNLKTVKEFLQYYDLYDSLLDFILLPTPMVFQEKCILGTLLLLEKTILLSTV
jgi:hypothetical protein